MTSSIRWAMLPMFLADAMPANAGRTLQLEQIYGPQAIQADRRAEIQWSSTNAYTTLEPSKDLPGAKDIVSYEAASGERAIVVAAGSLVSPKTQRPLTVTGHQWAPDHRRLLLSVAAPEARRNNPLTDAWLYDLGTHRLRQLGGEAAGRLLYPEFSPDGTRVAYVAGNDLFIENVDDSLHLRLTRDGSELLLNARGDIANEEEFGLGKAFVWSPDSRRIAYWQFDTSDVGIFSLIRNTTGQYPKVVTLRYPKPGTTNSAVRVGVVGIDRPGTTWFALPGDPRDHYVPRMDWSSDGKEVLIQHENRPQNTNHVFMGDPNTGAVNPLFEEKEATWLLPSDHIHWLEGGRAFTWLSERDGWKHLYVISRDGQRAQLRTPGEFDVVSIELIDAAAGHVYFTASPDNVTQRYLYRATLTGRPHVERMTPADAAGTHDYDIAPNARWAVHTSSSADTPPVVDVIRLPGHKRRRVLADNGALRALLQDTPHAATEFFKVNIGAVELDAWLMKPPDFDAAKKYPLLMYVYSEPAGQTVTDRWGGDRHLWHLMLTQRGYLVASVDSRGAAAPRGRDWRRSVYGQIGILASSDQAAAVRRMLVVRPYIDPARIGVWGWSGGGAMTLNAMFRYPDLYRAGIAVASPVDQLLYNSIYQERYMGLPADNVAGYRDGSPINFAQNLAGSLLIIHGTGDDNVHYQNAEQLVNRLVELNKPFSFMAYPDRRHGIAEGVNTQLHLFSLATRFLEENLMRQSSLP